MSNKPVKCVRCKTNSNVKTRGNAPVSVKCHRCGEGQSYVEFQQSLGEQVTAHAQEILGKSLGKMARNNKNITYSPGRIRKFKPKFTVGF